MPRPAWLHWLLRAAFVLGLVLSGIGAVATCGMLFIFLIGGGAGYVAHYGPLAFAGFLAPLVPGAVLVLLSLLIGIKTSDG